MPRFRGYIEDKPCERCDFKSRERGMRFCLACERKVKREMRESGYLGSLPPGRGLHSDSDCASRDSDEIACTEARLNEVETLAACQGRPVHGRKL
jgi:hypothetical protein